MLIRDSIVCFRCKRSVTNWKRFFTTKQDRSYILGNEYTVDEWTNITPKILEKTGRNLLQLRNHPLSILKQRIVTFFHSKFGGYAGSSSPLFSSYDHFSPVVTTKQNFDELLISEGHVARSKSDNYYINKDVLLRAHTSAHQSELIRSGLPAFLVFGDVYRRDTVDSTHYPVFHQCEGVRLFTLHQLFPNIDNVLPTTKTAAEKDSDRGNQQMLSLFTNHSRTEHHQETLTMETSKMLEYDLKSCLEDLMNYLFGKKLESRWVDVYFPFTHPSWELEIKHEGEWMEVLGCGVMEQKLIKNAGCEDRVGWAFGLGLERIAMLLYKIPDIRLFWTTDERFLNQFKVVEKDGLDKSITFEPFSNFMPLYNDISFWLNKTQDADSNEMRTVEAAELFNENDFYDLVRSIGGDLVENVDCFDTYFCKKTNRTSKTFRLTFRHFEKALTQNDVNDVKREIEIAVEKLLGGTIR